ncbi:hypothetical protein [Caulobacter sp.]|uniref:hypothetical protein n=1 Tax=Caulobacter sp. TaxID=78 RepID=UPI001B2661F8|nr:hypothetical protein [Caulobacter sp.]MBO9542911.1 hypothetical protein [Caulobacter sp.]
MTVQSLASTTLVASPLLRLIAPPYAEVLAALWPAPHAPFVTATAARRHLICLMLAAEPLGGPPIDVTRLMDLPMRKAIRLALEDVAPEGLRRALEHLGEIAWAPEDYRALVHLLVDPAPAKTLRHAEAITPDLVRALTALPKELREVGGVALRVTPAQAALLAETHAVLAKRLTPEVLDERVTAWGLAPTPKALFTLVVEDFRRELPPAPHPGTERLRPLETAAAIRDAARRYRNCLVDYLDTAVDQRAALYEWQPAPGAVVELRPDAFFGWRLDQARLRNNQPVDEATREAIVAELRGMGVHVGRSAWQIRRALERAASPKFELETVDAAIADYFTDD